MKCPFCLENNHCAVDNIDPVKSHSTCWCFAANVPDDMLELIPKIGEYASMCVCQKCIMQYHQNKESFISRFSSKD